MSNDQDSGYDIPLINTWLAEHPLDVVTHTTIRAIRLATPPCVMLTIAIFTQEGAARARSRRKPYHCRVFIEEHELSTDLWEHQGIPLASPVTERWCLRHPAASIGCSSMDTTFVRPSTLISVGLIVFTEGTNGDSPQ